MNIEILSARLAKLVPEMARDSILNNQIMIKTIIEEEIGRTPIFIRPRQYSDTEMRQLAESLAGDGYLIDEKSNAQVESPS